uniref:Uncharacterized protein n=1 Tax=viral metagenome TaxID=1070528 RepID=A0A6C0C7P3_9ZZZZ
MEQVLFGDAFSNIEQHLFPRDLYNLMNLCKNFSKMITENTIKKNVVNEINIRLRHNLGNNYDEFIEIMKKIDGVII